MIPADITEYMRPENLPLIADPANWHADVVSATCPSCSLPVDGERPFYLYTETSGVLLCMAGHYACAILEEYVELFREKEVDGWLA